MKDCIQFPKIWENFPKFLQCSHRMTVAKWWIILGFITWATKSGTQKLWSDELHFYQDFMLLKIWELLPWVLCWRDTGNSGSLGELGLNNTKISFLKPKQLKDLNQEELGDSFATRFFKNHWSANELWSQWNLQLRPTWDLSLAKSIIGETHYRLHKFAPIFRFHRCERDES
jgi:hypothetical protein